MVHADEAPPAVETEAAAADGRMGVATAGEEDDCGEHEHSEGPAPSVAECLQNPTDVTGGDGAAGDDDAGAEPVAAESADSVVAGAEGDDGAAAGAVEGAEHEVEPEPAAV